jgi:hypothetical protein
MALWQLGTDPSSAARYRDDADAFLSGFRLDPGEQQALTDLDLSALAAAGTNTLLLLGAYRAVEGPGADDVTYLARFNAANRQG